MFNTSPRLRQLSEISLEAEGVEADIVTQTGSGESQQEAAAVKNHLKTKWPLDVSLNVPMHRTSHDSFYFFKVTLVPPHQCGRSARSIQTRACEEL